MKKEIVTYSEAFKMQVVKEIGQGTFATIPQAQKAYGICGTATIQKWLKKYGMEELLPKRVRVETMSEIDELKEAKKRIRDLEKALSDSHMDYCLERAFLEIACEQMGTSRDELKKTAPCGLRTREDDRGCNEAAYERKRFGFEAWHDAAELLQEAMRAAEGGSGRLSCGTACEARTRAAAQAWGAETIQNPCSCAWK
jgi:transposase-like protein